MKDFPLTDDDEEFLDASFDRWKPVTKDGQHGIIIYNYKLPKKYEPQCSDLMIIIPNDYPAAALDMFYFSPGISRKDGRDINALTNEDHFGKSWQRWSRHYAWDPNIYNVAYHMSFVKNKLEKDEN